MFLSPGDDPCPSSLFGSGHVKWCRAVSETSQYRTGVSLMSSPAVAAIYDQFEILSGDF